MLPGFRFLFAAIVLSISILVFGLGAAALLRAAHEQFAGNTSWHAAPDATFAQQPEATRPVLAMLRIDPPSAHPKAADNVPAVASPAEQASRPADPAGQAEVAVAPAEPTTGSSAAAEQVAALKPEQTPEPDSAKPEIAASESPPSENSASESAAPDTAALAPVAPAAAPDATRVAATAAEPEVTAPAQAPTPASEAAHPASEPSQAASTENSASPAPPASGASTNLATLGDPAQITEPQRAKPVSATPERSAIRKRLQARREARRRRLARRARLALTRQVFQQPVTDPFGQSQPLAQPLATTPARKR
jgi:hypothetical protein